MTNLSAKQLPYNIEKPEMVSPDVLDTIDYAYQGRRDIVITIKQPEYTSVCPMTGYPDNGTIIIEYTPHRKIIELKSLKYYLLQYRNVGIFYEHLVNRMLDDFVSVLAPKWLKVTGLFTARGGITSAVEAQFVPPTKE